MPRWFILITQFWEMMPYETSGLLLPFWEPVIHPWALLIGWLLKEVKSWGVSWFGETSLSGDPGLLLVLVAQDPFLLERPQPRKHCGVLCDTRDLSLGDPSGRPLTGQSYVREVAEVQCIPDSRFLDIPAHYLPLLKKGLAHRWLHPNSHQRPLP